jgi:hypothetical protein
MGEVTRKQTENKKPIGGKIMPGGSGSLTTDDKKWK